MFRYALKSQKHELESDIFYKFHWMVMATDWGKWENGKMGPFYAAIDFKQQLH